MFFEDHEQFHADIAALSAEGVVFPYPLTPDVNPATALQVGQMPGHGGLGQFQHRHQVADAQLPLGLEEQDDAQADRVGQGFEGLGKMFHGDLKITLFL